MSDLSTAILILGCFCCLAFSAGCKISRHHSSSVQLYAQLLATALLPLYFATLWEHPILATIFPVSGLIILGNWLPLWASFFLGIYANTKTVSRSRRISLGIVTSCSIAYSTMAPSFGTAPECGTQDRILQYQTTPYTCSAACAASILNLHEIQATEGELAQLCLTRQGTHWMGLYRGLMLKTSGTNWTVTVEPFNNMTLNQIVAPCILAVNVDTSAFENEIDHGFQQDVGHSVVYLGKSPGDGCVVFDPAPEFGMEDWLPSMRSSLKSGVILRLVPRHDTAVTTVAVEQRVKGILRHRRLTAGISRVQ